MKKSTIFLAVGSLVLVAASVLVTKANSKKFASFTGTIYYGTLGNSLSGKVLIKACLTDALITTTSDEGLHLAILFTGTNQVLKGWNSSSHFYTLYY